MGCLEGDERHDCYVNGRCVDGCCPLIIEEELYGVTTSTCEDYCGNYMDSTCESCWFLDSSICNECCRRKESR